MTELATSAVLHAAADAIQMAGWTKFSGWEDTGSGLCLEGGIAAAIGADVFWPSDSSYRPNCVNLGLLERCPAYVAVREYLDMRPHEALWSYNDAIASSAEEVIGVLRAAAEVEFLKEQEARIPGEPRVYEQDDQPLPLEMVA